MGCIELVPIFGGLTREEMLEVEAITREKHYEKGETIYYAGRDDKRLLIIHRGHVKISRLSPTGKAQVIRVLGPGEFMGELTILNEAPLPDYAEALEPCGMCVVEGLRLKELMRKYPSIAFKVLEELSSRLEKAENLIEDINLHSAERRLARSLLELSGDGREFELALAKGDYASQLGMTQETLSRKLSHFQSLGLINLKGQRTIVVLDRAGLGKIDTEGDK